MSEFSFYCFKQSSLTKHYLFLVVACLLLINFTFCAENGPVTNNQRTLLDEKNKDEKNNTMVHLLPFSHDDVGWLKTVDEYYNDSVEQIINESIASLKEDATKKFTYTEMAYLKKWWDKQDLGKKAEVFKLIENKQIEILNGGWSANDEACPHYEDIIENMTSGMEWVYKNFGVIPKTAFLLDSFGHSSANAFLYAKLGFKFQVFSRQDEFDRRQRFEKKDMKFIWKPFNNKIGMKIFTEITVGNYCDPEFMRNEVPGGEEMKTNLFYEYLKHNSRYYKENVMMQLMGCDFMYENFKLEYEKSRTTVNNISADPKKYPNIDFSWSLPEEYLDALRTTASINRVKNNVRYRKYRGDFLPYGENAYTYWTGYYSSRPWLKYVIRYEGKLFQTQKNLFSVDLIKMQLAKADEKQYNLVKKSYTEVVDNFAYELGVAQHHDAITGTSKDHVYEDYLLRLFAAEKKFSELLDLHQSTFVEKEVLGEKALKLTETDGLRFHFCDLSDPYKKQCVKDINELDEKDAIQVTVYNQSSERRRMITIPYFDETFSVYDLKNNIGMTSEVYCNYSFDDKKDQGFSTEKRNCSQYFIDNDSFPYTKKFYMLFKHKTPTKDNKVIINTKYIEPKVCSNTLGNLEKKCNVKLNNFSNVNFNINVVKENDNIVINFQSGTDDQPKRYLGKKDSFSVTVKYSAYYSQKHNNHNAYYSRERRAQAWQKPNNKNSGPYIFRTSKKQSTPQPYTNFNISGSFMVSRGKFFSEVHLFGDTVDLKLRFDHNVDQKQKSNAFYASQIPTSFQIESFVKPIDVDDGIGKEVILEVTHSKINNYGRFETDSNGLVLVKRRVNFQKRKFGYEPKDSIPAQYYPVTSQVSIENRTGKGKFYNQHGEFTRTKMTILPDRTQGATSRLNGQLEMMLHRRLIKIFLKNFGIVLQINNELPRELFL